MKIATYNVNSVNARLPVLIRWLDETRPDVACLQELKAAQEKFPLDALREAGYHAIWHGQKAWNGVAILARAGEPVETGRGLAGAPDDVHSRYLEGTVGGVRIGCLYVPNGNPAPGPKFDYKLRWLDRFAARAAELVALPEPVVLAGDYNVIPEEIDVYNPAGWEVDALFRPESRVAYRELLAQGWTDALRHLNPGTRIFTFWDYTSGAWRRNAGLRIDHLLLNPVAARRIAASGVDRDVRGWEKRRPATARRRGSNCETSRVIDRVCPIRSPRPSGSTTQSCRSSLPSRAPSIRTFMPGRILCGCRICTASGSAART